MDINTVKSTYFPSTAVLKCNQTLTNKYYYKTDTDTLRQLRHLTACSGNHKLSALWQQLPKCSITSKASVKRYHLLFTTER